MKKDLLHGTDIDFYLAGLFCSFVFIQFFFVPQFACAQVNQYAFSKSSGIYIPISGTAIGAISGAGDSNGQIPSGTIPFTFNFYSTTATINLTTSTLSVGENGWICSGTTSSATVHPLVSLWGIRFLSYVLANQSISIFIGSFFHAL